MNIQDDSVVFCADQSVDKLKRLSLKEANVLVVAPVGRLNQ